MTSPKNIKDYVFVVIQVLIFGIYVFPLNIVQTDFPVWFRYSSLTVGIIGSLIVISAILQLNKNLSPFPTPKMGSKLIQNGVYKFVRHPIYTGIILMTFGYGFYLNSPYKAIIAIVLYILFYFKSSYEEQRLKSVFSDYENYKTKTGRFFPSLKTFLRK